jgi:hypothetical protein
MNAGFSGFLACYNERGYEIGRGDSTSFAHADSNSPFVRHFPVAPWRGQAAAEKEEEKEEEETVKEEEEEDFDRVRSHQPCHRLAAVRDFALGGLSFWPEWWAKWRVFRRFPRHTDDATKAVASLRDSSHVR